MCAEYNYNHIIIIEGCHNDKTHQMASHCAVCSQIACRLYIWLAIA